MDSNVHDLIHQSVLLSAVLGLGRETSPLRTEETIEDRSCHICLIGHDIQWRINEVSLHLNTHIPSIHSDNLLSKTMGADIMYHSTENVLPICLMLPSHSVEWYSDDEVVLSGLQGVSSDVECGNMDGERVLSVSSSWLWEHNPLHPHYYSYILTFTHLSTLYNSRSRGMLLLRCCGCDSVEACNRTLVFILFLRKYSSPI